MMMGMAIIIFLAIAVAALIAIVSREIYLSETHLSETHLSETHLSGKGGERAISRCLLNLPSDAYHVLNDLVLPTVDGITTQVDHVVISHFGIFVVETKDYDGWIFGGELHRQWTEVFPAGRYGSKKYKFQNPIRQNWRHIYVIAKLLDLPTRYFHNVVVFCGAGEFKTSLPQNVMHHGELIQYLLSFDRPLLNETNVSDIIARLKAYCDAVTEVQRSDHVQNLISRHDSKSLSVVCSEGTLRCPRCGAQMSLRHRRSDGKGFYGCSRYPRCRGAIDACATATT